MADVPVDAPAHCPGTQSDAAGKTDACQGCPSQQLCASGKANEPDPDVAVIAAKLSNVKHKIIILSGKGGVGKSSVTATLAHGLASNDNINVGVMDVDICGPSIPQILGLEGEQVHQSGSGWSPVFVRENLCVMSVGFLLGSPDDAVIWRGPRKNGIIKQFLRDVDWGELDYLLIDTPPGTSDEHLSLVQLLANGVDGAIVVSTPQEIALLDVRKEVNFCKKVDMPIIGVIENMSTFQCPKCENWYEIFPPTSGGALKLCKEQELRFLGKIPLDPRIGRACDEGKSFLEEYPQTPAAETYGYIVRQIRQFCEHQEEKMDIADSPHPSQEISCTT